MDYEGIPIKYTNGKLKEMIHASKCLGVLKSTSSVELSKKVSNDEELELKGFEVESIYDIED
ncbi:hypothetical protein P5F08_12550 [Clostridium perfringens]|nr:hypothetical protein [Clostridium perfringens]